jgi:integrase
MVTVKLVGVHSVRTKGRTYHYAWRGGPRLEGQPGSPEFIASYRDAIELRHTPDSGKFLFIVVAYKNSDDYRNLAATTRQGWAPWLKTIADHFGDLSIRQFNRPLKIRRIIIKWRAAYASTPRTADFGMQVLSRVISYGVDPLGLIETNPCAGIKHLYKGRSRAEIIWTDEDIRHLRKTCSPEIAYGIELAALTGLRLSDLVAVRWLDVQRNAIVIGTGKSNLRIEVVVPLYRELRELLARIPRRAPEILTNSKGRRWTASGFESSFQSAKKLAWPQGRDLHLHDLRGTAATKFYLAGFPEREIAEILGWEEEAVKKIIRRYVSRHAMVNARIKKLDAGEDSTDV